MSGGNGPSGTAGGSGFQLLAAGPAEGTEPNGMQGGGAGEDPFERAIKNSGIDPGMPGPDIFEIPLQFLEDPGSLFTELVVDPFERALTDNWYGWLQGFSVPPGMEAPSADGRIEVPDPIGQGRGMNTPAPGLFDGVPRSREAPGDFFDQVWDWFGDYVPNTEWFQGGNGQQRSPTERDPREARPDPNDPGAKKPSGMEVTLPGGAKVWVPRGSKSEGGVGGSIPLSPDKRDRR